MNPLRSFLPVGRHPRRVLSGYFADVRLMLDLRCEFQHYLGLYEAETMPAMHRLGRNCRSLIDLGAGKGELPIRFLRSKEVRRVIAVDPSAVEVAQFRQNLVLNALADDARLHIHAGYAGNGDGPEWRTLDDLGADLPEPVFIKIDIDGPEAQVLATGHGLLARECRLLIETHSVEAEQQCSAQLRQLGYTVQIIPNAWWRRVIPEQRAIAHNRWLAAWREPFA